MPEIRRNLFSVTFATDNGLDVYTDRNSCEFVTDGIVKSRGVRVGNIYKMQIGVIQPQ